jgi:hypothetical protein
MSRSSSTQNTDVRCVAGRAAIKFLQGSRMPETKEGRLLPDAAVFSPSVCAVETGFNSRHRCKNGDVRRNMHLAGLGFA